jgi:lambda family phage portal protein
MQLVQRRPATATRNYANARDTRTTTGFGSSGNASADAELSLDLTRMRARSRQMVRDASYAKRARSIIVNNVIGGGIGIQSQVKGVRGEPNKSVNESIERAWCEWMRPGSCHTGGALHFFDLERAALGQVVDAGEVFIRLHRYRFGESKVPLALELIEAERIADTLMDPGTFAATPAELRMGIEVDQFGRALAAWVRDRHPGDIRGRVSGTDQVRRVPAEDLWHLRVITRWPQTRGEPWMHTVLTRLDDTNEYTGSELMAARAQAMTFASIEQDPTDGPPPGLDGVGAPNSLATETDDTGRQTMAIEPLMIQELEAGQSLKFHSPNRPNSALDPFMRYMLREISAGLGVSYESLSRDYSQSNYSSSRLSLLDDRDTWRVLQQWWIRSFREPLHREWLRLAVMARAVNVPIDAHASEPERYLAVKFKLRGWNWVDPTKEVAAYKEAIKAGLTTTTDVIAQTADGRDIEDIIETRRNELEMFEEADIEVDTTVTAAETAPAGAASATPETEPEDNTDEPPRRVVSIAR